MRIKHLSYVSGAGKGLIGMTIGDALRQAALKYPKTDASVFVQEGVTWKYPELLQRSEVIAEAFVGLGLQKGSRIGIYAPNRKEWVLTHFAAALADLILVCINPANQINELNYVLNKAGVSSLVMAPSFKSSNYVDFLQKLCPEIENAGFGEANCANVPTLKKVIVIDDDAPQGMIRFSDLYSIQAAEEYLERTKNVDFQDPTNIQFTSGTTGNPKGATLTHHNIINHARNCGDRLSYTTKDRVCIPVPLYHIFGMVLGSISCVTHGATMVFPDYSFNPDTTMDAVESEKCTSLYGVPTMFLACLESQAKRRREVKTLRTGIVAGSICALDTMKRVVDDLNISEMTNLYGTTETGPLFATSVNAAFEKKISTVGQVCQNVEVKLIDNRGHIVEMGEVGEVCSRGYNIMQGYWDDEEANAKAIDKSGWMHTGDLGVMDDDGYLKIVGRSKDMVIRGGENVYPSEIENFLNEHPDIYDAQVIGVPDDYYGEELCVWIKMKQGAKLLNYEEFKKFCQGRIAHYKIPKYMRIVEEFPMTITGKVMKHVMRAKETAGNIVLNN